MVTLVSAIQSGYCDCMFLICQHLFLNPLLCLCTYAVGIQSSVNIIKNVFR
jgi:hypothetical protein